MLGPSTAVVCVGGDLDIASAAHLERFLAVMVSEGVLRLVLDLGDVEFCDCAGLGVLLRTRSLTAARGGWLQLERVPRRVAWLLDLTGTTALLEP
jgi:anti-anti-sigma factor